MPTNQPRGLSSITSQITCALIDSCYSNLSLLPCIISPSPISRFPLFVSGHFDTLNSSPAKPLITAVTQVVVVIAPLKKLTGSL
jgi:hypothetical protein